MLRVIGTPTDLPGCALWLDASDLSSITKDASNYVSQWDDKSGNARHGTQAAQTRRPVYAASAVNGKPACTGSQAADTRLDINGVTGVVLTGAATYFVVGTKSSTPSGYFFADPGNNNAFISSFGKGDFEWFGTAGERYTLASTTGSGLHILSAVKTDNHRLRVNINAACAVTVRPSQAITTLRSLFNIISSSNALGGAIAEVIVYSRALTDGEIVLVEQYLSTKWGVAPQRLIASPIEIPDCAMWFDAGQGVTYDANGVSQWDDASGNARHIAQGNNANKPTYNAANVAFAGKPTIDWDTVANGDRLDRVAADNFSQPVTIIACLNVANTAASQIPLYDNTSGSQSVLQRLSGTQWQLYSGAAGAGLFPTPPVGTKPFVLSAIHNTMDSAVRINGNTVLSRSNIGANGVATFRLGAFAGASPSTNWNGSVAELLIYRRRVNDGELAQVEGYLRRKYAL